MADIGVGSVVTGNLSRFDPRFVDPTGGDFRLRKESFLIDAALADVIPADIEGYREHFVAQPEPATDTEKAVDE